jgi:hypothetical protein
MARLRRDSKGRFLSRGGKSRRRGMGSIITVRRGMGAISTADWLAPLVGGGLTALTALGLRQFVDPTQGDMQKTLVKWAPLFGHLVGSAASLGLYFITGSQGQAVSSFVSATAVGVFGMAQDQMLARPEGATKFGLAFSDIQVSVERPAPLSEQATNGGAGFGAIVPEYSRPALGAIAMEPVGADGRRAGSIGSYGETVSLNGINTSAFGTPGFQA